MIKAVDKDSSGSIEFPEFLKLMRQQMNNTNTRAELERAFNVFDTSSTESVSVVDLRILLRQLCTDLTGEEVTELLMSAMPDESGNITFDQFEHMLTSIYLPLVERGSDTNGEPAILLHSWAALV